MILSKDNKTGLWYREGTDDLEFLGKEDIMKNHLPIKSTDTVMEIGGNIGDTTQWLSSQVKRIITYEPIKSGCECIRKNAPSATAIQAAIGIKSDRRKIFLTKHLSATNRFRKSKYFVDISYLDFSVELMKYRPSFIIMDCEGEEWNLIKNGLSSYVQGIAIEFHFHTYIKESYEKEDPDILKQIKFVQLNGPMNINLCEQFGPPIWEHGFGKHRNVSFAIWRK